MPDFKTQLDSDISNVFLNASEFAQSVTVTPDNGDPAYNIDGIFDEAYEIVSPDIESDISSVSPVLQVKSTASTALIVEPDKVSISGVTYQVTDTQPDGVGIILLILNLV